MGLVHGALVLGAPGTGKTTIMQAVVRLSLKRGSPWAILDRFGHWGYLDANPLVRRFVGVDAEEVCAWSIRHAPRNVLIDEFDMDVEHRPKQDTALREVIHYTRQAKAYEPWARVGPVCFFGSARRPMDISPDVRAAMDVVILLHMHESLDLDWVRKNVPGRGEELAARLPLFRSDPAHGIDYEVVKLR